LNKSRTDTEIKALTALLEKSDDVKYKKRLQGYGLRSSDFDSKDKEIAVTRRRFDDHKDVMLKSKLIMRLKTKGKKEQYYSITPVGIAYLLSKQKPDIQQVGNVFKILNFFYEKKSNATWRRFKPIPDESLKNTWEAIEKQVETKNSQHQERQKTLKKLGIPDDGDYSNVEFNHMERALNIALSGIEVSRPNDKSTNAPSITFSFTDIDLIRIMLDTFYVNNDGNIVDVFDSDIEGFDDHTFCSIASEFVLQYFYHILIQESVSQILKLPHVLEEMRRSHRSNKEEKQKIEILAKLTNESIAKEVKLLKEYDKTMIENNLEFLSRIEKIMLGRLDYIEASRSYLKSNFV
jgi:hypothetical protein